MKIEKISDWILKNKLKDPSECTKNDIKKSDIGVLFENKTSISERRKMNTHQMGLYRQFVGRIKRAHKSPSALYVVDQKKFNELKWTVSNIVTEQIEEGYISHPVICKIY